MKFNELNEEQKAKAIEQYRNTNVDFDDWDDFIRDSLKEKVSEYGFDDIEIRSDVSFTQGSGASFTCDSIDLIKYLTKSEQLEKYSPLVELIKSNELEACIERNEHRYVHENTVSVSVELPFYFESTETIDNLVSELSQDLTDFVRAESKSFHREAENHYLAVTTDEAVAESIIANEYDFAVKDPGVTYL